MGKEGKSGKSGKFTLGKIIGLRSASSGKYISCEPNGMVIGSPMHSGLLAQVGTGVQNHHKEKKKEKVLYGTQVNFKTQNSKFLCAYVFTNYVNHSLVNPQV
jgi:hypothetical protein